MKTRLLIARILLSFGMISSCGGSGVNGGSIDTTFNSPTGYATFKPTAAANARGVEVALQYDGKAVVVGTLNSGANDDLLLLRYDTDGTLDDGFAANGVFTYNATGDGNDRGLGLALQGDGQAVAAGYASLAGNPRRDLLALRLTTPGGALDTTFGNGGVVTFNGSGNTTDIGFATAVQPDGKILIAGESGNATSQDALILRLQSDGSLDATFGNGGIVTFNGSGNGLDRFFGILVQPDGKIVAVGSTSNGSNSDALVVRYFSNGVQDATFGMGGVAIYAGAAGGDDFANNVMVQSDGKIVTVGTSSAGNSSSALLLRYTMGGALDDTFGVGGVVLFNGLGRSNDEAYAAAELTDGRLLIVGSSSGGQDTDVLVARFFANGMFDPSFGINGAGLYDLSGGNDDAGYGLALQSDGRILVTGTTSDGAADGLFLLRLNP